MNNIFRLELPHEPLQKHYQIGLVVTTYNRPYYLRRCIQSLQRSILNKVIILIVDDGSNDKETLECIHSFKILNVPVLKAFRIQKDGCRMFDNLCYGWDLLLKKFKCNYLCNLDADAIVKKHWLSELMTLHQREKPKQGPLIVTGFNATSHPISKHMKHYYIKKSVGGINLFFDQEIYLEIVRPLLKSIYWDWEVVKAMQNSKYPILCTRPSVIQHIGERGFWSDPKVGYDVAVDYLGTNPLLMLIVRGYFFSQKLIARCRFSLKKLKD